MTKTQSLWVSSFREKPINKIEFRSVHPQKMELSGSFKEGSINENENLLYQVFRTN